MNSPVSVGTRISTMAYTYMGIELIISGIITIAMHYGIANGNPQAAFVYYSATLSLTTQFPVWGGAIAMILGISFIVVGSAIQNNDVSIKVVSIAALIGSIIQVIAFGFACNSMAATVRYIRLSTGPSIAYNYIPIVFCVVYMLIFLTNTGVCIRSLFLGRALIRAYSASVAQLDDQTKEAPGYVEPMANKVAENF